MENRKLEFTKMVASGNDFVVIDRDSWFGVRGSLSKLARSLCERNTGVGADGVLVLEKSHKADFRMRIFNADGSEAEMCGNGLRCAALYRSKQRRKDFKIETKAGIYQAVVTGRNRVKIRMERPRDLKMNLPVTVNGRSIKVNYIDTGVPHAVIFVEGLENIDVETIGRSVRTHSRFKPRGTNVDFVELIDSKNIKMRTYERGVEQETLACGTGAVASAIISGLGAQGSGLRVNVHTKGGVLKVYFNKVKDKVKDVYLEGEAREVFNGEVRYV